MRKRLALLALLISLAALPSAFVFADGNPIPICKPGQKTCGPAVMALDGTDPMPTCRTNCKK